MGVNPPRIRLAVLQNQNGQYHSFIFGYELIISASIFFALMPLPRQSENIWGHFLRQEKVTFLFLHEEKSYTN